MTSLIAWLDSTPEEQRIARELISMFSQIESRDELGIGQIRDAFSDLLFPGTSVIQTRARYYLFIPWCYTTGKAANTSGEENRRAGELQERRLIKALQDAKLADATGLIGSRVGPAIKNLPSSIYWSGMLTYGVRTHFGAIGSLSGSTAMPDGATELAERVTGEWDAGLPPAPAGFPNSIPSGFHLEPGEARWLQERMIAAAPESVLAHLLERGLLVGNDSRFPWDAVPVEAFEILEHARWFSEALRGAPLLYNLLIAERYEEAGYTRFDDPVGTYLGELDLWAQDFLEHHRAELSHWNLERMWQLLAPKNPNINSDAERFVERWIKGILTTDELATDKTLRGLVRKREERKGKQSRLLNDKMLATWSGAAGVGQLAFRWGPVRTIVNDILRGLIDDVAA